MCRPNRYWIPRCYVTQNYDFLSDTWSLALCNLRGKEMDGWRDSAWGWWRIICPEKCTQSHEPRYNFKKPVMIMISLINLLAAFFSIQNVVLWKIIKPSLGSEHNLKSSGFYLVAYLFTVLRNLYKHGGKIFAALSILEIL